MKSQLIELLRTKSLKIAPEGEFFTLASGAKSKDYLDVRKTALSPEGHVLLGRMLYEEATKGTWKPDLVAGVELGGCPLASAVSMYSALLPDLGWSLEEMANLRKQVDLARKDPDYSIVTHRPVTLRHPLPAVYVRKQAKDHGAKNLVEGPYEPGQSVLLIEDVVTSGGTSLKALEALRAAGLKPCGVLAVVDREQGGPEAFRQANTIMKALVTRTEVLAGLVG